MRIYTLVVPINAALLDDPTFDLGAQAHAIAGDYGRYITHGDPEDSTDPNIPAGARIVRVKIDMPPAAAAALGLRRPTNRP